MGKSHVATALAVGAIRAGHRALIRSTFDLAADFAQADATGTRRELVQQLTRVDLLVLEDFGMKKLGGTAAEDLLEVFVRRHETASTLIATNRPTQDWGLFLGDVPAAPRFSIASSLTRRSFRCLAKAIAYAPARNPRGIGVDDQETLLCLRAGPPSDHTWHATRLAAFQPFRSGRI